MSSPSEAPPAADYQVRLDIFEGPLDLLLYLVRKEEVELYEVSLERIIQQYLAYLGAVAQPDLDRAGDVLTLTFADRKKAVINTQRPTRQIWVAANARAWHFVFEDGPNGGRPQHLDCL